MLLGSLRSIWRYPVKSLRGEALEAAAIGERGILGDRLHRLIVESGHTRAGREYRGMENDRLHLVASAGEALQMAQTRGVALRIEERPYSYFASPISLVVDRWLDEISAHVGYAVEPERFRPNFLLAAASDFSLDEDALIGAVLESGEIRLRVRKAISRCVVITYHPNGEPSDPRVLRYVAQQRNAKFGVYCDVERTGTACIGDRVRLVER